MKLNKQDHTLISIPYRWKISPSSNETADDDPFQPKENTEIVLEISEWLRNMQTKRKET